MSVWVQIIMTALISILCGAAGGYFSAKFTDERRRKEEQREADRNFRVVKQLMPDLFTAMKKDLESKSSVRNVMFTREGGMSRGAYAVGEVYFSYNVLLYDGLEEGDIQVLENHGYLCLRDGETGSGLHHKYQLSEEFVALVLRLG